jgi:hypothetical protein
VLPLLLLLLLLQPVWTAAPKTERARGIVRALMCWLVSAAAAAAGAVAAVAAQLPFASAASAVAFASQQLGQLQVAVAMS